jgi:hypothetical protein
MSVTSRTGIHDGNGILKRAAGMFMISVVIRLNKATVVGDTVGDPYISGLFRFSESFIHNGHGFLLDLP